MGRFQRKPETDFNQASDQMRNEQFRQLPNIKNGEDIIASWIYDTAMSDHKAAKLNQYNKEDYQQRRTDKLADRDEKRLWDSGQAGIKKQEDAATYADALLVTPQTAAGKKLKLELSKEELLGKKADAEVKYKESQTKYQNERSRGKEKDNTSSLWTNPAGKPLSNAEVDQLYKEYKTSQPADVESELEQLDNSEEAELAAVGATSRPWSDFGDDNEDYSANAEEVQSIKEKYRRKRATLGVDFSQFIAQQHGIKKSYKGMQRKAPPNKLALARPTLSPGQSSPARSDGGKDFTKSYGGGQRGRSQPINRPGASTNKPGADAFGGSPDPLGMRR